MTKPKNSGISESTKQFLSYGVFFLVGVALVWQGFAAQADAIYNPDVDKIWWLGGILIIFGSMIVGVAINKFIVLLKGKNGKSNN